MAINKKLIHFKTFDTFNSKKLSADENNKTYTIGVNGSVQTGNPEILYQSICYIKDTQQQWTHGQLYSCNVDASNALWVDENNVVNRENLLINGTRDYTTYSYGNSEDGLMFVDTYTFEGNTLLSSISLNGSDGINLQSLAVNNPNLEEATSGKMSMLSISDGQVTYEGFQIKPGEEISPAGMLGLEPGFFTYQIYHINNTTGNADPVSGLIVNESHVQLGHKSAETIHSLVINANGVFVDDKKVNFEMLNVTYSELKNLRDSAQLIPGAMYRLTDYECTTSQENTASAGHKFDIILTATAPGSLSEECKAVQNAEDGYFDSSNLEAWKIWYTLDNDKNRFNWACNTVTALCESFNSRCPEELLNTEIVLTPYDEESYIESYKILYMYDLSSGSQVYFTTDGHIFDEGDRQVGGYTANSGKGVIYRMIDEFNNDCSYDFKNIKYYHNGMGTYVYTFTWIDENYNVMDSSVFGNNGTLTFNGKIYGVRNNVIKPYYTISDTPDEHTGDYVRQQCLNNIVFISDYSYQGKGNDGFCGCNNNSFGNECYNNSFRNYCYANSFGNYCYNNSFGNYCCSNSFRNECYANTFGSNCDYNSFGNDCNYNSFGNECQYNTFGNNCDYNSFGNKCYKNSFVNNCNNNSFGNNCCYNTFGNNCYKNSFVDECYSNSFGNECYSNSFGNDCRYNSFGNSCRNNLFGNYCYANSFVNECCSNSFGNYCYTNVFGNYCCSNSFGNECYRNSFRLSASTSGTLLDYCHYNKFDDGCSYNVIWNDTQPTIDNKLQNINVTRGVSRTLSAYNFINIVDKNATYEIKVAKNSNGEIKVYCEADLIA